ncbi:hypothetical protein EUGRSUZ_J01467 [Eucalyptus grandis]|uniref:Uncharacterized protein n=2 Tax=Eucalyptus grandis TaxID=71139 RepID=A0ACC3J557_EUCGR|nr:hypothetical protein EUGRSUZ_J01467 [Eucalyptus grandis]
MTLFLSLRIDITYIKLDLISITTPKHHSIEHSYYFRTEVSNFRVNQLPKLREPKNNFKCSYCQSFSYCTTIFVLWSNYIMRIPIYLV